MDLPVESAQVQIIDWLCLQGGGTSCSQCFILNGAAKERASCPSTFINVSFFPGRYNLISPPGC